MGTLKFHDTDEGRKAEGMVARGEIAEISAGYRVEQWEIKDENGNVIDPEVDQSASTTIWFLRQQNGNCWKPLW